MRLDRVACGGIEQTLHFWTHVRMQLGQGS